MSEHFLNVKSFLGIDNISDLTSVSVPRKAGVYFYEIDNIDIDDQGKLHRRKGVKSRIFTPEYGNIRSLWANDTICLFVDGNRFRMLNDDNTATTLIYNIDETDPMCYVEQANLVYFSNSSIVGYVDTSTSLPHPFPETTQAYKTKMVGGQILEWYNSRLYSANGANLFYSDATIPVRMDERKNAIAFPSRITMLKAVDDGIYVSDSNNVYFEGGADASVFVEKKVLDVPAIEGMSACKFPKKSSKSVQVAYWMTKHGIYAGYPGGIVSPMQGGLFNLDGLDVGTAIMKDGAYQQLLMVGKYKLGYGGATGAYRVPALTTTGKSS